MSSLYKIIEISGRGHAMVANKLIKRGTRIVTEEPVLQFDQDVENKLLYLKLTASVVDDEAVRERRSETLVELNGIFDKAFAGLSLNDKGKVMALADWQFETGITKEKTVCGVLMTNCITGAQEGMNLCPTVARINHSCIPNVGFITKESSTSTGGTKTELIVLAYHDIEESTEICAAYKDELIEPQERRQHLKNGWGFDCICDRCINWLEDESNLELSQLNRKRIGEIEKLLPSGAGNRLVDRKPLLDELIPLLEEERIDHPDKMARHCFDAMQTCQALLAMAYDNAHISAQVKQACDEEAAELRQSCLKYSERAMVEWGLLEGGNHPSTVGAREVFEEMKREIAGVEGGESKEGKIDVMKFLYADADDMDELFKKMGIDNEEKFGDANAWGKNGEKKEDNGGNKGGENSGNKGENKSENTEGEVGVVEGVVEEVRG